MMKGPDINDTLQTEGPEAVRARHDRAHQQARNSREKKPNGKHGDDEASHQKKPPNDADPDVGPHFSDEALAIRFAECHANDLRFVAKFGKWLIWTGRHWRFDDTLHAFDMSRVICRAAAASCNKPNMSTAIASAKTVAAVERLAKADRRLAATSDQWDRDKWLLNTPGGVIDLRNGKTRANSPDDYMTKMAAVSPGGACPIWRAFIDRITGGDEELGNYLKRLFGYGLTGITREHVLAFLYGNGANGKSVLLGTIAGIMGDYHTTAPIETFTASHVERHPTDLAGLMGARLVTASETEEGRRWAESKIKTMTGGDRVKARFMRQDFFEFVPQFKLVIAGNHKPGLRSVDEAIRRRLHLVPFTVTIPPAERDPELTEKLKAEWPAILQWMIDGCLDWQRDGLSPPETIKAATTEYLNAEDSIAAWIADCCEREPLAFEATANLYASYTGWCQRSGESPGARKDFREKLMLKNMVEKNTSAARGFNGLRLQMAASSDRWHS
jgi:putative DNA primase/helicase